MSPDVPGEVYAALRESADAVPAGPAAEHPDGVAAWWERHASADEAAMRAYERLHAWAVDTMQPPAVTAAIGEAITARRNSASDCRRDAAQAERWAR